MSTISDDLRNNSDTLFTLLANLIGPTINALEEGNDSGKNDSLLEFYYYLKDELVSLKLEGATHLGIYQFVLGDDTDNDPEEKLLGSILNILQQNDYIKTVEDTPSHKREVPPQ